MAQHVLINVGVGEVRVAAVENGRLEALSATRTLGAEDTAGMIGDIVLGRVAKVVAAVQAAFVEIGRERAGFLGAREARSLKPDLDGDPAIGELVREGDAVLVQIVKDPIGDKGARLTANVTIPGRFCVYTPFQPGVGISRRIEDEAERARLAALAESLLAEGHFKGGIILRTAAIGVTADELHEDLWRLQEEWGEIAAAQKNAKIPATLRRDLGPVERALRDMVHDDTALVLIDNAKALACAKAYCREAIPHVEDRIALFEGPGPLLADYEAEIEGLAHRRVALPSGGWITVEGTEALTAIDVNSGSFTHASAIEDTGLAVNLEAAAEIGRQIRLRGIGGLIVIDFIHLQDTGHIERVLDVLGQSLGRDGVPVNIAGVTAFGLVEVTRKRVREPLAARWGEDCPACAGLGVVRRADVVAMDVLRRIAETASAAPGKAIEVLAAPEVIAWLTLQDALGALSEHGIARVALRAQAGLPRHRYEVTTVA